MTWHDPDPPAGDRRPGRRNPFSLLARWTSQVHSGSEQLEHVMADEWKER
jgi:hypothetical protein